MLKILSGSYVQPYLHRSGCVETAATQEDPGDRAGGIWTATEQGSTEHHLQEKGQRRHQPYSHSNFQMSDFLGVFLRRLIYRLSGQQMPLIPCSVLSNPVHIQCNLLHKSVHLHMSPMYDKVLNLAFQFFRKFTSKHAWVDS